MQLLLLWCCYCWFSQLLQFTVNCSINVSTVDSEIHVAICKPLPSYTFKSNHHCSNIVLSYYTHAALHTLMYLYIQTCLQNTFISWLALPLPPPPPPPTACLVSLDLLAADARALAKGIKESTGELINNKKNENLKRFCLETEPRVKKLHEDLQTARVCRN